MNTGQGSVPTQRPTLEYKLREILEVSRKSGTGNEYASRVLADHIAGCLPQSPTECAPPFDGEDIHALVDTLARFLANTFDETQRNLVRANDAIGFFEASERQNKPMATGTGR